MNLLYLPAVLLTILLILGGCNTRQTTEGSVTLLFKHARILGPEDPLPRMLREFESRHPRIRVKSESLPWSTDEQHHFFVINLEGGNPGIDVLMLDVIWVPEFARAGWLLDLTPFLPADALAPHFPPGGRGGNLSESHLGASLDHERGAALLSGGPS